MKNVDYIIDWIIRMSKKHGGTVFDMEAGKILDWGQALCRGYHGIDWDKITLPDSPSTGCVMMAREWENIGLPEWIKIADPPPDQDNQK